MIPTVSGGAYCHRSQLVMFCRMPRERQLESRGTEVTPVTLSVQALAPTPPVAPVVGTVASEPPKNASPSPSAHKSPVTGG